MGAAKELLIEAVRRRTADSPYEVTETDAGFDVDIEIVDAKWYTIMHKQGLTRAWTYQVRVDESAKTVTITDVVKEISWKGGSSLADGTPIPTFSVSASGAKGRFESKSFRKTYAVSESGKYEKVVDYRFDSAWGRQLVRDAVKELGWEEKAGSAQRVGLVVAVVGLVLVVLIVVGVLLQLVL